MHQLFLTRVHIQFQANLVIFYMQSQTEYALNFPFINSLQIFRGSNKRKSFDTVSNFTVGVSENGSATSKRFGSYCDIGALSSKEDKRPEMLTSVKRRRYYGRFFHFHSSLKGGQNVMICHSQSKVGHTTIIY